MTKGKQVKIYLSGHRIALVAVLCFFALCVQSVVTQKKHKPKGKDEKIYLIHSDELKFDHYGMNPDAQIAKGRVHFRHQGAELWCDSAYFFQESNSVKAFGNVRFRQGDTLSLTSRYADYDGVEQRMAARYNVVLTHRKQVLRTDSLNYDRLYNYAYFLEGGVLEDGKDKLVADWGKYNLETREAVFYYNVRMRSEDTDIATDTLYYDTRKSQAHIVGPGSTIHTKDGVVLTTDAYYDTKTDKAQLFNRSRLEDSQKVLEGDSLFYAKDGDSYGYGRVVYIDKKNKNSLVCDKLKYNEKTGEGYATKRALLKDFSQSADTLYAHSDSIRIYTFNINTDSVYRKIHCYNHVSVYRTDVQAISDSIVFNSQDSCMTMYKDPVVWNGGRQLLGEVIRVYMNDSTIRFAQVDGQAFSVEQLPDKQHYNQVSSRLMNAYFEAGSIRQTEAIGNVRTVYYYTDEKDSSLVALNYMETDTLRMFLSPERQLEKVWASKPHGTMYPMTQIPPGTERLDVFVWLEDLKPRDKDDIFNWRGKKAGEGLVVRKRQEAPLQHLDHDGLVE